MSLDMKARKRVREEILKRDNFLITSHINLEADAVGSELALCSLLKRLGKKVKILNAEDYPPVLDFLPGIREVKKLRKEIPKFDTLIVIDAPNPERIGKMAEALRISPFTINIDHHISNSNFGDLNWVDKEASSAGEMLYDLFEEFEIKLDENVALLLYVAILTDTGSFRYINTTSKTHRIIGRLLEFGIQPHKIYSKLFENNTVQRLHLISQMLSTVRKQGDLAWAYITKEMLKRSEAKKSDLEGMIDYIRGIRGIRVAILFQECKGNVVKVGFRSKDENIDVNKIANYFGGGGHLMASGCRIKGKLEDVKRLVLRKVRAYIKEGEEGLWA